MPSSQLRRLKSSLREQGITGPQKSKKQKKTAAKSKNTSDRVARNAALQQIRDSFNPFEVKVPARPSKFQHATANFRSNSASRDAVHRPGVSKSAGEDMRRATLLPEMQRRNKTGALVDRRIGEGDPGMTAEEKAVQRFAREKSGKRGASLFDLEASDDEVGDRLTHGGRFVGDLPDDDFAKESVSGSESDDGELMHRKRRREDEADEERALADNGGVDDDPQPERKKSKKEVMEEVIAKSKLHKYERQKAKEDDDDLRDLLDQGTNDMLALLRGYKTAQKEVEQAKPETNGEDPTMNPERQKLVDGQDRERVNKEYDARLRELARDTRAKPSERTKTEEEKVREEAEKLKAMEDRRVKRMRGENVSDDEPDRHQETVPGADDLDDAIPDEAAEFGFTSAELPSREPSDGDKVVLDEEDEFDLDDDLIAGDSEAELSSMSASDDDSEAGVHGMPEELDEEDEFVKDILGNESTQVSKAGSSGTIVLNGTSTGLAFTYPCPRNHPQLLEVLKDSPVEQLPTIIQRIRALHHPSLSADSKAAMADFAAVLVEHLAHMGQESQPLATSEQIIRHLHSLSRTYPNEIATAFRTQLAEMHERKNIAAGDRLVLTAIGSIYPTSDHFHLVVTPAITIMCRWLGLNAPDSAAKHSAGAFLVGLCLHYQRLSKRYIPEAVRFTLRALSPAPKKQDTTPSAQYDAHITNLLTMAHLWNSNPSFLEIFSPFLALLKSSKAHQTLAILLAHARTSRRPLELHHHRPQPIRTSIPKFEDGFHPDKHYDPDKERSEAAKLKKEHKREKKGALRELRKDANFVAREQLREKRERDAEYEKKYRRLVASVQSEEGHEKREYEKAKAARKRSKVRG